MSVFSGVMAILSPNFVTRFLKESGRDVLSKLQAEYGVNCMRTSEDVCTVQGEWDAMLKVHSFLKEAENSSPLAGRAKAGGPMTCNANEQRNGGLTSSLNSDDHAADVQLVTGWGGYGESSGLGAAGLAHDEPSTYRLSNGPDALPSLGTVIHLVPTASTTTSARSLLTNMPKLTYKGQAPPPPPPLQPINRDPSSYPDHETDIKPSILVDENFMTNLKITPPKKKKSPKAIAKKSTAKKAGTAAKDLKKKLKEKTPAAEALAASLRSPVAMTPPPSDMPLIKTEPADSDISISFDRNDESLSNTDISVLEEMPVLTKQIDGSPALCLTPTKQEGGLDCLKCKKVFSEHKELEVHMYVYHNPDCIGKEIQCPYCSKIFLSKNGLEEHMYNHVGTRPFSCHLCPVSFNHRKSLRRHLERHSTTRKFSCDQCSLSFLRKELLDSHRLIHQKEHINANTKFSCNVCEEKFDNMASYRKHMQYDHYEINETLNLGPTTHLEEVDRIEDDEDVVDLFKDNDDGDWRKPKRKTKSKATPKSKAGTKRKATKETAAQKRKRVGGDGESEAGSSVAAETENGSMLDHTSELSMLDQTSELSMLDQTTEADNSGMEGSKLDHSSDNQDSSFNTSKTHDSDKGPDAGSHDDDDRFRDSRDRPASPASEKAMSLEGPSSPESVSDKPESDKPGSPGSDKPGSPGSDKPGSPESDKPGSPESDKRAASPASSSDSNDSSGDESSDSSSSNDDSD